MRKIIWTEAAVDYLANKVVQARKIQQLVAAVDQLAVFPEMYPFARSRQFPGCRVINTVQPFVIIYRLVAEEAVQILKIMDARQRW